MNDIYKPAGYASVSVYLVAEKAQAVIDFLVAAFDGQLCRHYHRPDGSYLHAEVRIDDTVVMLTDATADNPAFPSWLHVYVPDVDATYERALVAGGRSIQEPQKKPDDPDRRAGVTDPAGNSWWIATQFG